MEKIYINFDNLSDAEAQEVVRELYDDMTAQGIESEIVKGKKGTQDFGTILCIVLGSKAIAIIAKGIADYIKKRSEVEISIKDEKGEVIVKNARSKDIPTVLTQWHTPKT